MVQATGKKFKLEKIYNNRHTERLQYQTIQLPNTPAYNGKKEITQQMIYGRGN